MSSARGTLCVARLGRIDYAPALALQETMVRARQLDQIGDTLLTLEHPHVFTLGRGADQRYLATPRDDVPVYRVSRGGQVTYHGPGQLVAYPILKLEGRDRDVHRYLRMLEDVMVAALAGEGIARGWYPPLGYTARLRAQRMPGPELFRCDRALRNPGLRHDFDRRARPS
jgi:lipoyl(octanoyl) transferase